MRAQERTVEGIVCFDQSGWVAVLLGERAAEMLRIGLANLPLLELLGDFLDRYGLVLALTYPVLLHVEKS